MLFNNIYEAISKIEEISASIGAPLYYRAQHHDWAITSSIHRIDKDEGLRNEEVLKAVNFIEYLKEKKDLLRDVEKDSHEKINLCYWAIAQHYGYKTDLIDFTTDIQVAKGFALIGKKPEENGCIVCLWKEDVELIVSLYKAYVEKFPPDCQSLLKSVNCNPFFHFNLSEVSRIVNQKGVFLWDVNSFATQLFSGLIDKYSPEWIETHTFRFKQTDISVEKEILRMIYPTANVTEMEIDRYLQFYNRDFYYKHNTIPEFPPIECDLSHYFMENTWNVGEQLFFANPLVHYPSKEHKTVISVLGLEELTGILNNPDNCKELAFNWSQALEKKQYIMYVSANNDSLKLFAEILNEALSVLSLYENLSPSIIGIIIFQALRLLYELFLKCRKDDKYLFNKAMQELAQYEYNLNDPQSSLEGILDSLRTAVPLDVVVKEAWEREFLFVKLRRYSSNTSVCVLPKDLINDCSSEYKREHMRILNDLYDQSVIPPTMLIPDKENNVKRVRVSKEKIKWELMLNIVTNPKILFSQIEFFRFFVYYIIPWQIIMCPKRNRIYNPFEIEKIRRLDADNFETGHLYYWGGAYCTIQ